MRLIEDWNFRRSHYPKDRDETSTWDCPSSSGPIRPRPYLSGPIRTRPAPSVPVRPVRPRPSHPYRPALSGPVRPHPYPSVPLRTRPAVLAVNERRLSEDEKPLLVQLNWNKDDREGRFLLRRMDLYNLSGIPSEASYSFRELLSYPEVSKGNPAVVHTLPPHPTTPVPTREQPFTRKLSKREKKELKKAEKMRRANETNETDASVAEKLYTELPETSFTRSISNPEAVMRRRRAQKLEKKLQQFRSKDGGPDTGGTLKIYGESLRPDVPYKTLLLSIRDNAHSVVREMLEKYGLYKEDPNNYCLVQAVVGNDEAYGGLSPQKEYILDDDECPLAILMNHHPSRGRFVLAKILEQDVLLYILVPLSYYFIREVFACAPNGSIVGGICVSYFEVLVISPAL
ncbi:afadin-like [Palaemon carinicauda]|uniref:afadin-like n=1 Tax=Palaemon carinicauda TaxID=392227 RepID=UPI0035B578D2